MPHIIIVEDDPATRRLLELVIGKDGFDVSSYANGKEALAALEERKPDAVIADLMMPEMDGIEICRALRARPGTARIPILVVTARDQVINRYEAFSAGADDYINKPFDPIELMFRLRSYLRLTGSNTTPLATDRLRLDPALYTAWLDGREIALTRLETAVLQYLIAHKDAVVSAEQISADVLGHRDGIGLRTVDAAQAHIRHLRQKLEPNAAEPTVILTVGRKGYRLAI